MTQIKGDLILFDLDGTLVDSAVCVTRQWEQWAQQHGLDLDTVLQAALGIRSIDTIRRVAPHLPAEEEARRFNIAEVADTEDVFVIEGASRLLNSLPSDAWGIVTSGSQDLASARLRHTGLPFPNILVTADDVTQGKPAPEPYLLAAMMASVASERCVVIEDAPFGIEAAQAAGMQVIATATTHSHQELLNADAVIKHLSALRIAVETGDGHRLTIQIDENFDSG